LPPRPHRHARHPLAAAARAAHPPQRPEAASPSRTAAGTLGSRAAPGPREAPRTAAAGAFWYLTLVADFVAVGHPGTFILYLTDCSAGGETVLLERLVQPSVLATVTPRRGRLLVFPHACPHKAQPVVAHGLPKILLRGEML
jgi:hypothetical protein